MFTNPIQKLQSREGLFAILSLAIIILIIGFIIQGFSFSRSINDFPGTLSVTGVGEVSVSPDIARFTFSVSKDAKTIAEARDMTGTVANPLLAQLEQSGIEKKDIKLESFNVYPKYEYEQNAKLCTQFGCPGGKQVLVGYTYTANYAVTLRVLDKASDIAALITDAKVTTVNGPEFTVEDMEMVKNQAKTAAIRDAKAQSKQLARQLGVRIDKLIDFQVINDGGMYPMYTERSAVMSAPMFDKASAPEMPAGENKVKIQVMLNYRLK